MTQTTESVPPSGWESGSPAPWILKIFGGLRRGPAVWLTRGALALAGVSLGLFTVTRLMLIHWVFLVPASLGSLFVLGCLYLLLEMRRKPVAILEIRPGEVIILRTGEDAVTLPLGEAGLRDRADEHCFDILRLPEEEVLLSVPRDAVRDVSLYETIRRFLSVPPAQRLPVPVLSQTKGRFYRWFIMAWSLIILLMVLWALYENYAAPRSYEPFSNP